MTSRQLLNNLQSGIFVTSSNFPIYEPFNTQWGRQEFQNLWISLSICWFPQLHKFRRRSSPGPPATIPRANGTSLYRHQPREMARVTFGNEPLSARSHEERRHARIEDSSLKMKGEEEEEVRATFSTPFLLQDAIVGIRTRDCCFWRHNPLGTRAARGEGRGIR